MQIDTLVSTDFVTHSPNTPVSKLVGTFADSSVKGVVVHGDEYRGVVTRRQLTSSHRNPDEKLGSIVWHVPRLSPDTDVRDAARLMLDSDSQLLPVFEDDELTGVVTVDGILAGVQSSLDALTVRDVYTRDLIAIAPASTMGEALHTFRDQRITHLPVVDDDESVGLLSLHDVTNLIIRSMTQSQGGDAGGVDPHGSKITSQAANTRRGGYGSREGELARILDLPVRDLMVTPVRSIDPDATLEEAVESMFSFEGSSLVVTEDGSPFGIVTKTDILDSLTWEAGGNRGVQVYGIDLIGDTSYEDIISMVDTFDDRDHGMSVIDAKIHLQEHDERRRGTPLLLARIRLHTDQGLFVASGEGFGASHALNEAREVLERQIRDQKTYGRTKKHPDETFWEKRFGWLLEAAE